MLYEVITLAGGFRAEDFDHPPSWEAADAQRPVQSQRAGGNDRYVDNFLAAQTHDRAFSVLALDLGHGGIHRFLFFG